MIKGQTHKSLVAVARQLPAVKTARKSVISQAISKAPCISLGMSESVR